MNTIHRIKHRASSRQRDVNSYHDAYKHPSNPFLFEEIMKTFLRSLCMLTVAVAFVAATSTPAMAASSNSIAVTDGTRAAEVWFNKSTPGTHANKAWFDLLNAKCDAHSVYVEYRINGDPPEREPNDGGCDNPKGINLLADHFTIQYRVCVDMQFRPDVCADDWTYDINLPMSD
jgi:hypothetical protein